MSFAGAATLGAAAITAYSTSQSSKAAGQAANDQEQAEANAEALAKSNYATSVGIEQPWQTAGTQALTALNYGLGIGGQNAPLTSLQTEANFDPNAFGAANKDDLADYNANAANLTKEGVTKADFLYKDWQNSGGNRAFTGNPNYQTAVAQATPSTAGGGTTAGTSYGSLTTPFSLATFQADPGYQFDLSQGEQGINRAALASGRYNSGATMKALDSFDTGLADQTYTSAFNRYQATQQQQYNMLAGVSSAGQQAANTDVNAGNSATASITAGLTGGANAAAAGTVGQANALTSGLNTGLNYYQGQQTINALNNNRNNGVGTFTPSSSGSVGNYWD